MHEPPRALGAFLLKGARVFGPKAHCVVVVGAQWGDEGKGKIVDVLAERADLVVRYQGGANAGHTVHTASGEFVLHQIPSGIIQGAVCVVGNGVALDPETFFTELDALAARGIKVDQKLFVSDRAHLTLPLHQLLDQARERREKIGTTGRGIGPTYEDKYGRRGLRVGDLRNLARARDLVAHRVAAANEMLGLLGGPDRADATEHCRLLERLAPRLLPLTVDAGRVVYEALDRGESVLLEGAQGALLDVDHGTYPYVTSSNTTAGGAAVGAGIGPTAIDAVLGVVKAYTTRVGNGPLPTEAEPAVAGIPSPACPARRTGVRRPAAMSAAWRPPPGCAPAVRRGPPGGPRPSRSMARRGRAGPRGLGAAFLVVFWVLGALRLWLSS